jgi:hypothetical protein
MVSSTGDESEILLAVEGIVWAKNTSGATIAANKAVSADAGGGVQEAPALEKNIVGHTVESLAAGDLGSIKLGIRVQT